jgi:hypothetical protein
MKTRILRDSNYSFLITKEGFSRRIQSGTIEYDNCKNELEHKIKRLKRGDDIYIVL